MKYQWFAAPIHAQGQRPVHLFPRGARRHRAFSQYPSAPNTRMEIPTGRVFRAHRSVTIRTRSDSLTQCCSWFLRPPSHDWMIANVPTDKAILEKWLKAGYVYQNELFPTKAGTPQGGIISPVLANMTLDGLEARLAEKFPRAKTTGLKMNMVRYADDFIITGRTKEWLEHEVKPVVVEFLAERGLVLSPEKTKVTHIKDGFDFLGWNIRKYDGKLLMKPSKANVK